LQIEVNYPTPYSTYLSIQFRARGIAWDLIRKSIGSPTPNSFFEKKIREKLRERYR
jgi:hypothetical protein